VSDEQIPPNQGWMAESLRPIVTSGPPSYSSTTDAPIRVFDVRDGARILGYLWAAYDDDAAAFVPHESAGDDAFNASVDWRLALREPKSRGAAALHALDELVRAGGPEHAGTIDVESRRDMASLAELKALARS
jgi:hypothetical protein